MRAGLLARYQGIAFKQTRTQSAVTGASHVLNTQLGIFRFSRQTINEQKALLGKEEGTTAQMIIQCRKSDKTDSMTHYKWDNELYRIDSKILNPEDQTFNITATRVNQ